MQHTYPKLKEYCREKHGLEFQVVDMRWGVRDEATDDHKTTELCMQEIDNCQRVSVGPNFVVEQDFRIEIWAIESISRFFLVKNMVIDHCQRKLKRKNSVKFSQCRHLKTHNYSINGTNSIQITFRVYSVCNRSVRYLLISQIVLIHDWWKKIKVNGGKQWAN